MHLNRMTSREQTSSAKPAQNCKTTQKTPTGPDNAKPYLITVYIPSTARESVLFPPLQGSNRPQRLQTIQVGKILIFFVFSALFSPIHPFLPHLAAIQPQSGPLSADSRPDSPRRRGSFSQFTPPRQETIGSPPLADPERDLSLRFPLPRPVIQSVL